MVHAAFHSSEVDQMSNRSPWKLKSKKKTANIAGALNYLTKFEIIIF